MKSLLIFSILFYKNKLRSLKARCNNLKDFFYHDFFYHVFIAYILLIIIIFSILEYKHIILKFFSFKPKKKYKNLPWIPSWIREILKNKHVFHVFQIINYCFNCLKYIKCICEIKWILFAYNHHTLVICINYILFSICLFISCYILTQIIFKCYQKYNGEVILYKFCDFLDHNYTKLKSWFYKRKRH